MMKFNETVPKMKWMCRILLSCSDQSRCLIRRHLWW